MGERVLVTGGTGYVGGWAIVALIERGYEVRTTVRTSQKETAVRAAVASEIGPSDRLSFAHADLLRDEGWDVAMDGIDYVLHVASPLGDENSRDADALIVPARDGALRVLRAASRAGVKRVVMTSAANAASPASYTDEGVTDETLWTVDSPSLPAYRRSKTIAEKAAWDYMAGTSSATELTTVLPGAVLGPILSADNVGTASIVQRMLRGTMPGAPRIGLEVVDVRDLVDLHIRAMASPDAAGQRFLGNLAPRPTRFPPGCCRTSLCGSPRCSTRRYARSQSRWGAATATARRRPSGLLAGCHAPPRRPSWPAPRA